ncbi:MAG TPA: GntR family transcriptional regulator [Stellaceae bacterium]|jgi:DNA-binding GntR family transcriptional regulator|nr:GntR family transcriptional regulator [Stellaceae bacterium]
MNSAVSKVIRAFPAPEGTLHGALLDNLRQMINQGDLAPGIRVPERMLCQKFSVSRTPLREALKVLAAEGLVVLLPNRGARVTALDEAQLCHLFEVIALLEAEAGRLAASRIGAAALAEIQGMHYRMYAHFLRQELPEYFALNQAIHEAILDAAENPVLKATYMGLAGRLTRARYLANQNQPERWQQAMDEHEMILATLIARDGDKLAKLLAQHLANKRDIILKSIRMSSEGEAAAPAL